MNKRNKDFLQLFRLLKKITFASFLIGSNSLKRKSLEKIYLCGLNQTDSNLYIWKTAKSSTIGFRTFYCGVNAFVPKDFKKCWISDHHIMSIYYRIGINSLNIVPHNGDLYTVQFRRTSVPPGCDIESIHSFLSRFSLLDGINQWIDLFYENNDEKILVEQGIVYPEFKLIDRDVINSISKIYQINSGIKKISKAREKLSQDMERTLSLVIAG